MNIKIIGLINYLKLHGYTQLCINNKLNDIDNMLGDIDLSLLNKIFIVGLDGGFIAEYFLKKNENVKVTVFETENQIYNHISEEYLYITYGDRINIQYTNIDEFCSKHKEDKYDLIFINSDRSKKKNIEYLNITKKISHRQTNIVMTKTNHISNYNGAKKCWEKMLFESKIKEIGCSSKNKKNGLDMSFGKFILS